MTAEDERFGIEIKSMAQKVKGRATIRIAALFFLASAVFEIMDFNSPVALFGGVRSGATAVGYHFGFTALYFLSGLGMWTAKPWGYGAFMTTTAIYTIDKVQLILFRDAFYDYILQQLTVTRDMVGMIPKQQLTQYFMIAYIFLLLCWWGFALYIHMRRQYFQERRLS
jgi:TRAP-type C4-dicarboxylate transport system permease large subunit